jgi:SAM-dependent methyltransferase
VLEAAVGTGRLLVPLLQAGLQVEGIDSSPEMLGYCRRNCELAGLAATLHCATLEEMDLPSRYSAIVISFGSFMLLSGPGEAVSALDRIKHHLVPGGRLYVDVEAPGARGGGSTRGETRRIVQCSDGSTNVLIDAPVSHDVADRIERRLLSYEKWKNGRVVGREVQDFRLRRYDQVELSRLLTGAGFGNIDVCGDYAEGVDPAIAREWLCFSGRPVA